MLCVQADTARIRCDGGNPKPLWKRLEIDKDRVAKCRNRAVIDDFLRKILEMTIKKDSGFTPYLNLYTIIIPILPSLFKS